MIRLMCDAGAAVDIKSRAYGNTPLFLAARHDEVDAMRAWPSLIGCGCCRCCCC